MSAQRFSSFLALALTWIFLLALPCTGFSGEKVYEKTFKDWKTYIYDADREKFLIMQTINAQGDILTFERGKETFEMCIYIPIKTPQYIAIKDVILKCNFKFNNGNAYPASVLAWLGKENAVFSIHGLEVNSILYEMTYGNSMSFILYDEDFPPYAGKFSLMGFRDASAYFVKLGRRVLDW